MGQLSPFRGACLSEIMTGVTPAYVVSPFANANNTPAVSATPTIINTQVFGVSISSGGVGFSLTSSAPASGDNVGGTTLTITGVGFSGTPVVTVGETACTNVVRVSSTSITCTAPAKLPGTYDIFVTIDGVVHTLTLAYTSFVGFSLASISPTSGLTTGGEPLTITGFGFQVTPTSVTIGGTACTTIVRVSSKSITCVTPAKAAGTYGVSVTIAGVTHTLANAYTVTAPVPILFVQYRDSIASDSLAFTADNTASNLLVAALLFTDYGTTQIATVTDSRGNVWTRVPSSAIISDPVQLEFWYAQACGAGANTLSVTWTAGGPGFRAITIAEYSGVALVGDPVNAVGTGVNVGDWFAPTTNPFNVTHNSVICAFVASAGSATGGGPTYTLRGINAIGNAYEDRVVVPGTYTADFVTQGGPNAITAVAFKGQ